MTTVLKATSPSQTKAALGNVFTLPGLWGSLAFLEELFYDIALFYEPVLGL